MPTKDNNSEIAKELAWTICNAILDSDENELGDITLKQLVLIRDIILEESNILLREWKN